MFVAITNVFPLESEYARRSLAFQTLAVAAQSHGLDFLVCTPQILRDNGYIEGWELSLSSNKPEWRSTTRPARMPTVFYNATYLNLNEKNRNNLAGMRKYAQRHHMSWFNPLIPGKHILFQWMSQQQFEFGGVPTTFSTWTMEKLLKELKRRKIMWLKPGYGSGGANMLRLELINGDQYYAVGERMKPVAINKELSVRELKYLVRSLVKKRLYFLQENVELLEAHDGGKIDFRVTLVRDSQGKWQTVAVTMRKSASNSYLTNYHAGGSIYPMSLIHGVTNPGLNSRAGVDSDDISVNRIEAFAHNVADLMQSGYPSLGVLGIDVAQTSAGDLLVYDCNTRPGRDILTDEELRRFMQSVGGFASYLHMVNSVG